MTKSANASEKMCRLRCFLGFFLFGTLVSWTGFSFGHSGVIREVVFAQRGKEDHEVHRNGQRLCGGLPAGSLPAVVLDEELAGPVGVARDGDKGVVQDPRHLEALLVWNVEHHRHGEHVHPAQQKMQQGVAALALHRPHRSNFLAGLFCTTGLCCL